METGRTLQTILAEIQATNTLCETGGNAQQQRQYATDRLTAMSNTPRPSAGRFVIPADRRAMRETGRATPFQRPRTRDSRVARPLSLK